MFKRRNALRYAAMAGLAVSGAYLVQGTSCVPFLTTSALTATDFCFIFDCQNGFFGGTVQPCNSQTLFGEPSLPFFADCPTTSP